MLNKKIDEIDCYGEMHEGQNISVVCEDEIDDGIFPTGFKSWGAAVSYLQDHWDGTIVELEAV